MRYDPNWEDMSDFVVHVTKEYQGREGITNFFGILSSRRLELGEPFGFVRKGAPADVDQRAVCFSEVPLHLLGRLAERRKCDLGIGFKKKFVLGQGVNPIWYVEQDGPQHLALKRLLDEVRRSPVPAASPLWNLAPFIDITGDRFHSSGTTKSYRFEWEREWRKRGDFSFSETDVAFLIIPEDDHARAREFFATTDENMLGPSYTCPIIDPHWNLDQVRRTLGIKTP